MSKRSGFYPRPAADTAAAKVVSQAGGVLLTETVRAVGLDRALSDGLAPWRRPNAVHDPAKVVLDLAVTLAVGGDCLADIARVARRTRPVRPGGLGSDGVADDRPAGRRPGRGAARDQQRPGRRAGPGLGTGRRARPRPRHRRRCAAGHRCGRHPGHRALGQGGGRADVLLLTELPRSSVVSPDVERAAEGYVPRP